MSFTFVPFIDTPENIDLNKHQTFLVNTQSGVFLSQGCAFIDLRMF